MARLRTIKPEFFTSEQIVECSTNARLQFLGILCFSDDGGIHPASVKRLKMEVWPGDQVSEKDVTKYMAELIRVGLVGEFESSEGDMYWWVTGWSRHQRIDKPTLRFPGPFDEGSKIIRLGIDDGSTSPRPGMERSGEERNGEEKKGKDQDGRKRPAFVKPTLEEVAAYCQERGNQVSPEQFIDRYEANGWMVGKAPMKDWRACLRNWERNHFDRTEQSCRPLFSPRPQSHPPYADELFAEQRAEDARKAAAAAAEREGGQ